MISYVVEDKGNILNADYAYLISHCGYADAKLFDLSSFSLCRTKDLECLTSSEVKEWIKKNQIELIRISDLPKEWLER